MLIGWLFLSISKQENFKKNNSALSKDLQLKNVIRQAIYMLLWLSVVWWCTLHCSTIRIHELTVCILWLKFFPLPFVFDLIVKLNAVATLAGNKLEDSRFISAIPKSYCYIVLSKKKKSWQIRTVERKNNSFIFMPLL